MNKIIAILASALLLIACEKGDDRVGGELTDEQMFEMLADKRWIQTDLQYKDTADIIHINEWNYYPDYTRDNYYIWYRDMRYVIHDYARQTPGAESPIIDTGSWALNMGSITQVSSTGISYPVMKIDTISLTKMVLETKFNDTVMWRTFEVTQ